jgi:hypothetical protein
MKSQPARTVCSVSVPADADQWRQTTAPPPSADAVPAPLLRQAIIAIHVRFQAHL